ncbi:MAG: hypothetical protein JXB36_03310 [Gammaproteobacteria bacterium]|nr:hypothetical protein [Gammaproteobacteria bacterium]
MDTRFGAEHGGDGQESRRGFLQKAGKLAVYTPPLMIALMHPSKNAIAQSGNNGLGQRVSDPQPPGLVDNPGLWNDEPTSNPGEPNNNPNN